MSHVDLLALLDDLERLLQEGEVDGEAITSWQRSFNAVLAVTDRNGDTWPQVVARSKALAQHLDAAAARLSERRDQIRKELALQDQGARALKGYKPS